MPTDTTTTTPQVPPATERPGRRPWIIVVAIAVTAAVAAAIITLAMLVSSQGSQISTLRSQVASAQSQAAAASSAAQQAGKTQAAASNANLGVCVSYGDGVGDQTVVTSPVKSASGAVSCYSGTFTPVSPQPQSSTGS
jgi:hypothetical protein